MDEEEFRRQLDAAMRPQPAIEQARGILMYRLSLPPARAFAELARAAETHRVPLPVLAEALVCVVGGKAHLVDKHARTAISTEWHQLRATSEPPAT